MDPSRDSSRKYKVYGDEANSRLATPSNAEKIEEIRQQLETLLANARSKNDKKAARQKLSPTNIKYCSHSLSINGGSERIVKNEIYHSKTTPEANKFSYTNNRYCDTSLSISESSDRMVENFSLQNESILPVDAKLTAYKRFIESLTRIIQETNPKSTPDTNPTSTTTQKRSVDQRGTFLIQADPFALSNTYEMTSPECQVISPVAQRAEKTTYCRPVIYARENHSKNMEKNEKLHQLVKKLVVIREKEKQMEAWNNYINELKNKHGHCEIYRTYPKIYAGEHECPDIMDDCNDVRHSWKHSNLCDHFFNDLYKASNDMRTDHCIRRRTWASTSKPYRYTNNSYCCPISSQARLMKRDKGSAGYRPPGRYYRGSSIVVEKKPSCKKKFGVFKTRSKVTRETMDAVADFWQCRAMQTGNSYYTKSKKCQMSRSKELRIRKSKELQIEISKEGHSSDVKTKFEKISSYAGQLKQKIKLCRSESKHNTLVNIEQKLDVLMQTFNVFLDQIKSKKMLSLKDAKSAAVSCSSLGKLDQIYKAKSDTYSILNKGHSIICEMATQNQRSTLAFPPCPIRHDTIDAIMNEEKDKSDKAKKDIEEILSKTSQCAVKITIDIPTKEHSTEVSRSFYKTQQKETIMEEIEPIEKELCRRNRNMTIAVNTDPLGLLALIRVSAETVKQILSYVPNLDYVTYLARRQLGHASPIARYVCNICGSVFTRPSMLNEHIQGHEVGNSNNCCVCRHVLDRISQRSGMFACTHCGQVFTRAYCRELHQQTCTKRSTHTHRASPSLMLLS